MVSGLTAYIPTIRKNFLSSRNMAWRAFGSWGRHQQGHTYDTNAVQNPPRITHRDDHGALGAHQSQSFGCVGAFLSLCFGRVGGCWVHFKSTGAISNEVESLNIVPVAVTNANDCNEIDPLQKQARGIILTALPQTRGWPRGHFPWQQRSTHPHHGE